MCIGVLQMALLEIQGNGESSYVSQEAINNAIQLLEDPLQRVCVYMFMSILKDEGILSSVFVYNVSWKVWFVYLRGLSSSV